MLGKGGNWVRTPELRALWQVTAGCVCRLLYENKLHEVKRVGTRTLQAAVTMHSVIRAVWHTHGKSQPKIARAVTTSRDLHTACVTMSAGGRC